LKDEKADGRIIQESIFEQSVINADWIHPAQDMHQPWILLRQNEGYSLLFALRSYTFILET
jgi:hypothetical protein